jgi:hypothetical protein
MDKQRFISEVGRFKERLRGMVLRAELPEGSVIREDDLRRESGESVRVVRHALRELAREGLLLRRPRVGTLVAGATVGRAVPRLRSVAVLSSMKRAYFSHASFGGKVLLGLENELQAPKNIDFHLKDDAAPGGLDDPPRVDVEGVRRRAQGLIALEANHAATLNTLVAAGIPVVAIDFWDAAGTFDTVAVDHLTAGYLATTHLLRLGHRTIAFAGEMPSEQSTDPTWQDRITGYIRAMAEAGQLQPLVFNIRYRTHRNIPADLPAFHTQHRPTAYVLCSTNSTPYFLEALRSMNLRCPRDVSIACADGSLIEAPDGMRLSRIRVDYEDLGEGAARLLEARLAHKNHPPVRAVLAVQFDAGDSSRATSAT